MLRSHILSGQAERFNRHFEGFARSGPTFSGGWNPDAPFSHSVCLLFSFSLFHSLLFFSVWQGLDILLELQEDGALHNDIELAMKKNSTAEAAKPETLQDRLRKLVKQEPVMLFMKGTQNITKTWKDVDELLYVNIFIKIVNCFCLW